MNIPQAFSQAGRLEIITAFDGTPRCVIETQQVDVVPFDQVSGEFAATEGEAASNTGSP